MKRARIFHKGAAAWAELVDHDAALRLPDGETVATHDAHWLAPVTPGATIFALGLNYGDHAEELGFKKKEPPLVFLKGPNTLVGHLGETARPADANQMHPECELVAVIGRPTRRVGAGDALDY